MGTVKTLIRLGTPKKKKNTLQKHVQCKINSIVLQKWLVGEKKKKKKGIPVLDSFIPSVNFKFIPAFKSMWVRTVLLTVGSGEPRGPWSIAKGSMTFIFLVTLVEIPMSHYQLSYLGVQASKSTRTSYILSMENFSNGKVLWLHEIIFSFKNHHFYEPNLYSGGPNIFENISQLQILRTSVFSL